MRRLFQLKHASRGSREIGGGKGGIAAEVHAGGALDTCDLITTC